MSGFEVINSGIFTLLQDKGRFSYTHLGITNSGVMDEYAALMAHKLLKNPMDTNVLEIAFSNVILKATANTHIAICGSACEFFINNVNKEIWQTYEIKAGDIIKIGKILNAQRVYLAVKNGFKIAKEFGSNATTLKEELGGLKGNKISNNDFLPYEEGEGGVNSRLQDKYVPTYDKEILTLRVLLSYQESSFPAQEKEKFFNSIYSITSDFNRMACKLRGEVIKSDLDGIISEGISFGSIQIPKDGQPIILLKERQTIGGYPKIGSVINIDCFKLAQRKIGSKIRFEPIDIQTAQKKQKDFNLLFN